MRITKKPGVGRWIEEVNASDTYFNKHVAPNCEWQLIATAYRNYWGKEETMNVYMSKRTHKYYLAYVKCTGETLTKTIGLLYQQYWDLVMEGYNPFTDTQDQDKSK